MTPEELEKELRAWYWMPESCKGCEHLTIMSTDDGYRFDALRCKAIEKGTVNYI